MTVSVLGAEVPLKKNISANVAAIPSADKADYARALDQVSSLMLDALQAVMEGPANNASQYQISTRGSLLRARLALASCRSFECSQEYAVVAAACCELIHNASLVHDDLLDGDQLRRGQPTVWKRHGRGVALCAGDLLLCSAFAVASGLEDAQQSRLLTQYLAAMTGRVIVGQSIEIAPVKPGVQPRFRAYIKAAQAKTVPLIQLPLMTGAIAAKSELSVLDSIKRFAEAVGLAYQIIDDLDDLAEPMADLKSKVKSLHPFHAWHHHRGRLNDSPELRVQRATRHALAALWRGRRQLKCLETQMATPITPTLGPLLMKLECRAQAHRYSFGLNGE
ncbi:geranylgeranyl diphosphate synthase type II [Marinobacter sp. LV10R520-4]|uniref:polyprenyl synthetase family protein n=1 Tax=Marinobacter sp. LV10R520-4 TaxID=1761796 RepID=UPI000BF9FFE5|nr:polyprenyl synthetase family protein [Marinobacter sp. LV10R520-4]PFG51521.1 geranylgeranyl diphosphate synthase type II [Marinobacter sp. LV10R520-4]